MPFFYLGIQHDVRPSLSRGAPEQEHQRLPDVSEVVVALYGGLRVQGHGAKQLHPHDGVDEEQHAHQHADIWESLQGSIIFS